MIIVDDKGVLLRDGTGRDVSFPRMSRWRMTQGVDFGRRRCPAF